MRWFFFVLIVLAGCETKPKIDRSKLTKVTVREIFTVSRDRGNYSELRFIVQDRTDSKAAYIPKNAKYIPVVGDEVMVSGWDQGVWGDACIENIVKKTQAEVEYP